MTNELTISRAIDQYLHAISLARSANTARTYRNAMAVFINLLDEPKMPPETTPATELSEDVIGWLAEELKVYSPATEQLYLTAAAGFFEYLAAEQITELNLPRVRLLIRHRARKPGVRLPQFPHSNIEKIIVYAINLANIPYHEDREISYQPS